MDWTLLGSRDFWRGMFAGLLVISMMLIAVKTVAASGIIEKTRDAFALWRARKADFDRILDEVVELRNKNVELRDKVNVVEDTNRRLGDRYDQLQKSKKFQAHMIERLADHCVSLDPRTPKSQFLVSARTHAENKMEENGE